MAQNNKTQDFLYSCVVPTYLTYLLAPEDRNLAGNEEANNAARIGGTKPFHGPELAFKFIIISQ